jgi:uncharacterized protein YdeI (YjbR/CyaY-like superfamily)
MKTKTTKPKTLKDDIQRLERAQKAFEAMEPDERHRALVWFKSKYAKEWPHDPL